MTPSQDQNSNNASRKPPVTQTHNLDEILNTLHNKYGLPILSKERCQSTPSSPRRAVRRESSYTEKLKSLMESNPQRVKNAIASLDAAANELGNRWKSKGGVGKLVTRFEEILEDELFQTIEAQSDRDFSVLQLIGMESSRVGDMAQEVHPAVRMADTYQCDGRFDDPVVVCPGPVISADRGSPYTQRRVEGAFFKEEGAIISTAQGILEGGRRAHLDKSFADPANLQHIQYKRHFLGGIQAGEELVSDAGDSDDQSFYSCSGTPPPPEPIKEKAGLDIHFSSPLPIQDENSTRTDQRPRHSSGLVTNQQTSYLRLSMPTSSSKGPQLSKTLLRSGPGIPRGFHSPRPPPSIKKQGDFGGSIQASFDTTTTGSAQSSFDAPSSFSTKAGKYLSPPTSADTSSNEAEDTRKSMNRTIRSKRSVSGRLSVVTEGIGVNKFLGDLETLYQGDLDSEATDIDDPEINPITPSKRSSRRSGKNRSLFVPHLNHKEYEGGQTNKGTKEDDGEAAFLMLAEDFFGGESRSSSDSPVVPTTVVPIVMPIRKVHEVKLAIGGDEEVQTGETLREVVDEDLVGGWFDGLGRCERTEVIPDKHVEEEEDQREEHFQEPWDDDDGGDDDEFGTIDTSFEDEFLNIPALKSTAHPLRTLHFSVQHEATRVALNQGYRSNEAICTHLNGYCDDLYEAKEYRDLWKTLTRFSRAAKNMEWTSRSVWMGFKESSGWPDNVYLTGKVHWDETLQMPSPQAKGNRASTQGQNLERTPLTLTLNPLTRTRGNRFFNRFGSDRFLTLRLPSLQGLPKDVFQQRRERIIDWLVDGEIDIMNRTWKCFYVKDHRARRKLGSGRGTVLETFNQAIFFATKGVGIGEGFEDLELEGLGFRKGDMKLRHEMSVEELLEWHIPLNGNINMTVPKFWSRISLGFSDATPTVTFKPSQIEFVDDFLSPTKEVMDDGCSVASPAVMKMVRQMLGYDVTPTAVQARLGGAKGIWMVDPEGDWNSEDVYIRVTTSQLKYKGHDNDGDWARLTLDVLAASHDPTPATINMQLIPILEDRGIPFATLKELLEDHLEKDLEELFRIVDEPVELRRWMYDRGNVGRDRMMAKTIATLGAVPATRQEIAILLLESGFLVRGCHYLMTQVRKMIDQYCDDLKTKLHIKIPHSTTLFCVADPTHTLEEGEVSLRFSNGILDPKTMRRNTVITGDILVARNPAHLPSDIQKVKAVDIQSHHSPKLKELQDVIVFSVKGDRSLASLLSGGDYDGDKPWVCWDERLVQSFQNSQETFDEYEGQVRGYFEKSPETIKDLKPHQPGFINRFLRRGISDSLKDNFLGPCTSAWERFCYSNKISDPLAIEIAKICSSLVDAPKQGLTILPSKREEIAKLSSRLPRPAYKDLVHQGNCVNVIDRLHFDVAGQKVMEKQTGFYKEFGETAMHESVLTEIYRHEEKLAKVEGPGKPLDRTLRHLRNELRCLKEAWMEWIEKSNSNDGFKSGVPSFYRRFRGIKPPEELSGDPTINRWISDGDSHLSRWSLLRASAAYHMWHKSGMLIWYMAGRELCFLKSQDVGRKSEFGTRTVIEEMYIPLKTSRKHRGTRKEVAVEEGGNEEDSV